MSIVSISDRMVTINAEKKIKQVKKNGKGITIYNADIAIAVSNSINGYKIEIDFLQVRHFPRNDNQENNGILSYHAIRFLQ